MLRLLLPAAPPCSVRLQCSSRRGGRERQSNATPMSDAELQQLVNEQLPTAQTCFFDLYLPAYSNEDIMRQRLLTVINLESWDNGNVGQTSDADEVSSGSSGTRSSTSSGGGSDSRSSNDNSSSSSPRAESKNNEKSAGSEQQSEAGARVNQRRKRKSKSRKRSSK